MKINNCWTKQETNILLNNYKNMTIKQMSILLPEKTTQNIRRKLSYMKLRRYPIVRNNLEILNNKNNISFYWLGFLSADAHFDGSRIIMTSSIKDKQHIENFLNYINAKNPIKSVTKNPNCINIKIGNKKAIEKIIKKFKIHSNKTKNPIDLSYFDNKNPKYFLSFICGFIDGDGWIHEVKNRTDSYVIGIMLHKNWKNNLIKIFNFLHNYFDIEITSLKPKIITRYGITPQNKITKRKFTNSSFVIYKKLLIKSIKKEIIRLNLPFLTRKWDKIVIN